MHRLTVKTSTIFIAKGGRTKVYRSVDEVPRRLREEMERSTNGFHSATILIADRRGREEIVRALNGLPSELRSRLVSSLHPTQAAEQPPSNKWNFKPVARFLRRNWLEILLPVIVGGGLWWAFNIR